MPLTQSDQDINRAGGAERLVIPTLGIDREFERSLFVTPPDGILAAKLALNGKPLLKYWFFINIEYGENPRRTFYVLNRFLPQVRPRFLSDFNSIFRLIFYETQIKV